EAAQHVHQRDLMHWQRRLAGGAPDALIRIGEQGRLHLGETRPAIGAIVVGDLLDAEKGGIHGKGSHIPQKANFCRVYAIRRSRSIAGTMVKHQSGAISDPSASSFSRTPDSPRVRMARSRLISFSAASA